MERVGGNLEPEGLGEGGQKSVRWKEGGIAY